MFGAAQSWHCPMVEKVAPLQLMHSVLSSFGPVPAPQAEQVVLSSLTMLGAAHSAHSMPKPEYVVPVHDTQAAWSAEGALLAGQLSHDDCVGLVTLPLSQP
jgi:hypothetical protein